MILDKADQVMVSYAPTAVAAAFQSYIDRLAAQDDGAGCDIGVLINVSAAVTAGGGAATVQFQVVGNASDATFASGNVVLFDSGAIAKATLVAGYQIRGKIKRTNITSQEPTSSFLRYMTILVTIATNTLTTGTFDGWLLNDAFQDNLSYPAGYTV